MVSFSWKEVVSAAVAGTLPLLAAAAIELQPVHSSAVVKLYEDQAQKQEMGTLAPGTRLKALEKTPGGFRVLVDGKQYWVSTRQMMEVPKIDGDCSTRDPRGMQMAAGRMANEACSQQIRRSK